MRKKYYKWNLLLLTVGVSLLIFIFLMFYLGHFQINNPDRSVFPIRGIDISHFQQEFDWQNLKNESIRFVFIKATEGADYRDPKFIQNWTEAKKHGIARGAYHFFTFCSDGKSQAENFINTVPIDDESLPPVIDLEFGGNCSARPEKQKLVSELKLYISEIERVFQKKPIFYLKQNSYEAYIKGEFPENPLWIQDIFFQPKLSDERRWLFWQYSIRGRITGITTFIDLNVFNGDENDFNKLFNEKVKQIRPRINF